MELPIDARTGTARSTPAAFAHALPAIALVAIELWLSIGIIAWAMALLLGGSIWTLAIAGALLSIPGIWCTWHLVRLAIEAERNPADARRRLDLP
jgi:cation transporter-like permease